MRSLFWNFRNIDDGQNALKEYCIRTNFNEVLDHRFLVFDPVKLFCQDASGGTFSTVIMYVFLFFNTSWKTGSSKGAPRGVRDHVPGLTFETWLWYYNIFGWKLAWVSLELGWDLIFIELWSSGVVFVKHYEKRHFLSDVNA